MPAVSIVLPAYNSAAFVRDTIGSIIAQTFSDWELLIVDDGSTDDTSAVVQGIDPRISVIRQSNAGIAAARNTGISAARAPYVAFIDHDDLWHPEKLEAQLAAMQRHPECRIVYGEFVAWDPATPPQFPHSHLDPDLVDERLSGWIYHELLLTNWVLFSTALIHREVFERVGLFDPVLPPADDWDMAVRASRHFRFHKLAQPVTLYRQHALQTSRKFHDKDLETDFRERVIRNCGLAGPDGREPDAGELRRRRFRAHLRHGTTHFRIGNPNIAVSSIQQALLLRPTSLKAWLYYFASWGKVLARTWSRP